ncbi:hypothetical protein CR513_58101, partial [Mucuna pruriens]
MVAHTFVSKRPTCCPIEDFKWCWVPNRTKSEWAYFLYNLRDKDIKWYPKWNEREEILYQCGGFSNFPPTDKLVTPVLVHRLGILHLQHRVELVRLPFANPRFSTKEPERFVHNKRKDKEVANKLNDEGDLKRRLEEAYAKNRAAGEKADQHRRVEEAKWQTRECLKAANTEMCLRRKERDQTLAEKEELIQIATSQSAREQDPKQKNSQGQLRAFRPSCVESGAREKSTIGKLGHRHWRWKSRCGKNSTRSKQQYKILKNDSLFWEDRYRKITWLANRALMDILGALRRAQGMIDPLKTPMEISCFLELCTDLINKMESLRN